MKSTILIGQNYLFNYIAQADITLLKIFIRSFFKKTLKQKVVASSLNLLKNNVRISLGLQIRASNTT